MGKKHERLIVALMHQADAAPADANIGVSPHIQNPTIFLYNLLPKVELFKYSLLSVKSLKIKEFQSNFSTKPPTASKVICYTENKITIFDENHQKKIHPQVTCMKNWYTSAYPIHFCM